MRYDMTPPRPQDVSGSDYPEELWQSILAEGTARERCLTHRAGPKSGRYP